MGGVACVNDSLRVPRCNHDKCWDKYFTKNLQERTLKHRLSYLKTGKKAFELVHGYRFTKHFIRYIQVYEQRRYGGISTYDSN